MKSTFILILSLFLSITITDVSAQNMPKRHVLVELFTNTPCPSCVRQNPGFFDLLDQHLDDVHQISFYPGRPYRSCPIYAINEDENVARRMHRSAPGTPFVYIDGANATSSGQVIATDFTQAAAETSMLHIGVEETDAATNNVVLTITNVSNETIAGRLHAALVQRDTTLMNVPGSWETHHRNVFHRFLTAVSGDDIALSPGVTTATFSLDRPSDWEARGFYILSWVEDADRLVINSGTRFDEAFSSTDDRETTPTASLSTYPNPAHDVLFITSERAWSRAEIINLQGQIVSRHSGYTDRLDISDLAAGSYVLTLFDDEGAQQQRFVKVNK